MSEINLASFGITNAENMIATPEGLRMLSADIEPRPLVPSPANPTPLIDYVRLYANDPGQAEEIFADYHALEGNQSQLYYVGDNAELGPLLFKVSAPHTISGLKEGAREYAPEDLVLQLRFLNSLNYLLKGQERLNIEVPEHYFAMKMNNTHSLTIMQYLPELIDVDTWLFRLEHERKIPQVRKWAILTELSDRIQDAIIDRDYDPPLGDLFYDEEVEEGNPDPHHILRAENVLIHPETHPDQADNACLWLIDYPPPFMKYAAAARLALERCDYYPYTYEELNRSAL